MLHAEGSTSVAVSWADVLHTWLRPGLPREGPAGRRTPGGCLLSPRALHAPGEGDASLCSALLPGQTAPRRFTGRMAETRDTRSAAQRVGSG